MKKTIAAIALHLAALCAVITVIGVFSGTVATEGKSPMDGVLEQNCTLRILENDTAIKQGYLKELLDAFNAEYAQYNIVAVDANMDQYSDLEKDGPYGFGPDVLYQANDRIMKYVEGRHIQPLPVEQLECYDKVGERAWSAYKAQLYGEDAYFGVPVNVQGPVLYYRKDLLPADWKTTWDKDGNDVPDMIESWNELYRFSLQRKKSGVYGYMKSLFDPYFAVGYLFSYGAYVFGNNDTDTKDIGFSKGEAAKGGSVIRQLASVMNEGCIDDTITVDAYSKLGDGTYFATMTTPDVYTMFIDEMVAAGMTRAEAVENLGIADIPMLPKSGDLTEENPELIPSRMMGGINGYAVSSYTEYPDSAMAFVNFATKYEWMMRRNELLGIVPARSDAAEQLGGLTKVINKNLNEGHIAIMPSVSEVAQIWTPTKTFFSDLAKDPYRDERDMKYLSLQQIQAGLERVDKQIYDVLHTLG